MCREGGHEASVPLQTIKNNAAIEEPCEGTVSRQGFSGLPTTKSSAHIAALMQSSSSKVAQGMGTVTIVGLKRIFEDIANRNPVWPRAIAGWHLESALPSP
jgi:hypothetical protein